MRRRFVHPEWKFPQLVVIDGGVGQYHAVAEVFAELGITGTIPMVSVIKDDRHKPKGFHGPEDIIKKHKKAILLANSESHRFAIGYHRQMRSKDFLNK